MKSLKNQIILVSLFLFICAFFIESPSGKGGIDNYMHYVIYFVTVGITLLYLSSIENLIVAEKVIYSLGMSFFGLFASLLITERILEKIYGYDYELFLSNLVANLIFYFLTNVFLILTVLVISMIKKPNA